MSNSKCAVLVPVAKTIEPETEKSLTELANRGYPVRFLRGGSQVDLVRSVMASQAVFDGFEETLWVDSDVVFEADDVERLREHSVPLVAGIYIKKDRDEFACQFIAGATPVNFGKDGGLLTMGGVGMGFTLVRREVYSKIADHFQLPACGGGYDPALKVTPYFLPLLVQNGESHQYLSEDYSFCFRATAAGIPILADTRIRLGHVHRHVRTWDDLVTRQRFDGIQVEVKG